MSSNRSYKTGKGTELPLLNLRGKEYLEVKYRIVWFREDHPDWSIETEMVSVTEVSAYAKATIRDEKGRIITTSHKYESVQGFQDFIEKSETGAIGRALALIGYGTQFCADELDEGERVVDSPVKAPASGKSAAPKTNTTEKKSQTPEVFNDVDLGAYVCSIGRKHKGKKLRDIGEHELNNYLVWLRSSADSAGGSVHPSTQLFMDNAEAYLKSREFRDPKLNRDDVPY